MTEHTKQSRIKTVEVLQIAAGLTAALRWAIALMPLDGVQFTLSSREWFEPVSFVLSILFVIVEIGATAYIMRAWRKEVDKPTKLSLMALWVVALFLMTFTQVPPVLANVNGKPMTEYPFWFQVLWSIAGVSVTFVVIGGVGYAEKSLEAQPAASLTQPLAKGHQDAETEEIGPLSDDSGEDMPLESSQQAKTGGTRDLEAKSVASTVVDKEPLESPVLSTVSFDDYQLTGDTRADLRALLVLAPLATNASLARKLGITPERVRQVRASLAQEAQGVKP